METWHLTNGAATLPPQGRVKDQIKRIQEYVWARHIDGSDHYDHSIDEEEALKTLDAFYSEIGSRNNPDQVYLGILLFERAFEHPDQQDELFERARKIFEFYRRVTGETDWPAVEDRLEDIYRHQEETAPAPAEPAPAAETPAPAVHPVLEPPPEVAPEPEPAEAAVAIAEGAAVEVTEEEDEEELAARREAAEAFIADLKVVEGMELVPGGSFLFGPERKEVFLDSFYIDRTPVTNADYMRFVRETGYRPPRYAEEPRLNQPDQPVVGVSYADAVQYARWAGKELPSERQWEKAARGTDGRDYPWGNDPPGASDAVFGQDPEEGAPRPAGGSLRNVSPFGVLDLCGNVWEWTSSKFRPGSEFNVVRGGSYNDPVEYIHVTFRLEAHPKDKCEVIGFRCVKNIHHG